ncbi:MAG: pyridoxal-phosphate dependent enzyme [Planctomycetes bacterium]|nr:pyridoxal-phosphate dependent enzyme [Planctomycetota bacterium]
MQIQDDILGLIGRTPMVKLRRITAGLPCTVVGKLESWNPSGSVKDRTAARIVAEAERRGLLKPGGTIVESTSGNMGVGLSLVAAVKGYKCIVVTTDKQSEDKVNLVKAYGSDVRICPTAVEPDDPRSFYSVGKKIAAETPNSFYANQFFNPDNPAAHYATTGPEIWEQTDGKVDVVVSGLGTGGSLCGAGRYLKEKNPNIKIVGADPQGSLFYDFFHTKTVARAEMYKVEGIGEDVFPSTLDFSVLDDVIRTQDGESFRMARRLAREEGILGGGSTGAGLAATMHYIAKHNGLPGKLVVFLVCERGERSLGKTYNDEWMRRHGFLLDGEETPAKDLVHRKGRPIHALVTLEPSASMADAIRIMQEMDVSTIPVVRDGQVVGTVREEQVIDLLLHAPAGDKNRRETKVEEVMEDPLPEVSSDTPLGEIHQLFLRGNHAVLVKLEGGRREILTKYDLIHGLAR